MPWCGTVAVFCGTLSAYNFAYNRNDIKKLHSTYNGFLIVFYAQYSAFYELLSIIFFVGGADGIQEVSGLVSTSEQTRLSPLAGEEPFSLGLVLRDDSRYALQGFPWTIVVSVC